MLPTATKLLEEVQQGRNLTTDERRLALGYLMGTQPQMTNEEASQLFRVSSRTVREDKRLIREKMANEIREEDPAMLVADILCDFRRQVRDIEHSKNKAKLGSKEYLAHCVAVANMRVQSTKLLQDLGFLPKNMGSLVTEDYIWETQVNADGSLETKRIQRIIEKKAVKPANPPAPRPINVTPEEPEEYEIRFNGDTAGTLPKTLETTNGNEEDQACSTDSSDTSSETV